MLQDFAEKCNRSGSLQMHLMLISHKEISNYIDKLPKNKVDGWRGISERFKHIHLNNNFAQTYEIIGTAIQRMETLWKPFVQNNSNHFTDVLHNYGKHNIFSDLGDGEIRQIVYNCYPLHPVSTFILPRLSERVAQNERTLFTFISAPGAFTLPGFLSSYHDDHFEFLTPDRIYDYFEPLLKKEVYGGLIYEYYYLTELILDKLEDGTLESRIIKTLALIYILEQFEKLQPSKDEIIRIYSMSYTPDEITLAIDNLIEKEYVIYLRRSNNFLRLKQASGIDVRQKIGDTIEVQRKNVTVKDTLNHSNFDNYMYPSRYNNAHDMIRFFAFEFIDEFEVTEDVDWNLKTSSVKADGVIYGIIPHGKKNLAKIRNTLLSSSELCERTIFVVPKDYEEIEDVVREYNAVFTLRDQANDEKVLFEEYDVIYEDLREVIESFMRGYTRPEDYRSRYIYHGEEVEIRRKAALSELMSSICDEIFSRTPVINNEAINKNDITRMASNSRNKIVRALLRNDLEPGLGLTGSGQEVSIMRSTLIRTGVLGEENGLPTLDLRPNAVMHMGNLLKTIEDFILECREGKGKSLSVLYDRLQLPEYHIGIRSGVIPIYLAAVIHKYKKEIILSDQYGQVPLTAETLIQVNSKPEMFTMSYLDWNSEKEELINSLDTVFSEYIVDAERNINSYDYIASAMRRWYMALPKYAKESKVSPAGDKIKKEYTDYLKLLRMNTSGSELLFDKLKILFGEGKASAEEIRKVKSFYDSFLAVTKMILAESLKKLFALPKSKDSLKKMSLYSVIRDWCESLNPVVFEQLFSDGTERMLEAFRDATNDDALTVENLARIATDLRLEDWNEKVKGSFFQNIEGYKKTAEEFHPSSKPEANTSLANAYQITFMDESGKAVTKRFDRVENTSRGNLLRNQVTAALDSMGKAMSDQEKRQVLMEVLKGLC